MPNVRQKSTLLERSNTLLAIANTPFPVVFDDSVVGAIEADTESAIVVTIRFIREISYEEELSLRDVLVEFNGWYIRDLEYEDEVSWNRSRTAVVLRALWDFTREDVQYVLHKFFRYIQLFPIISARVDSIESNPAEDME